MDAAGGIALSAAFSVGSAPPSSIQRRAFRRACVQFITCSESCYASDNMRVSNIHPVHVLPMPSRSPSPVLVSRTQALILASAALLISACGYSESGSGPKGRGRGEVPIPTVEAVQARYGALPLEQRFSGTVRADNQVAIYPDLSAPIVRVVGENGQYVRQGDPLVYLRDVQFRDQLRQAEAALQVARADAKRAEAVLNELKARLKRTEELAAKQYQSQAELQAMQAEVAAAEAGYEQALGRIAQAEATVSERRDELARTVVRAPISGHIGQRDVEVGMRVDPNTRLYTLGNLENVRVEIPINDDVIGMIEVGQTALISSESMAGQPIRGEVARISPFMESGSFSAEAEIDVDNRDGRLRPGMFVQVDVHYGQSQQATIVPVSALYEDPNSGDLGIYVAPTFGTEVPVAEPDTFDTANPPSASEPIQTELRPITVLARGRETAGVQGVNAGDWVVTIGQNLLSESLEDRPLARIRPIPWSRVVTLQRLQDQDLLRDFMEKQQRVTASGSTAVSQGPDVRPTRTSSAAP